MTMPNAPIAPIATIFRLSLLAAGLLSAFSAQAQAQAQAEQAAPVKTDTPAVDTATIQKVEVQGKADAYDPRRDDTASKIVVNHDELVKYGDTSVLDALKRVPGVTVSGSAGRGGEIRMRGLGSGYTQVLINGERAPAGFDISSLSPDMIERVEVLRAASAEFSTQSIAGTVNIVLKKTVKSAQRELKLGYGQGYAAKNGTMNLQLSDKRGKLSWSFSANLFHSRFPGDNEAVDTFRDANGGLTGLRLRPETQASRFRLYSVAPRLNYTFDNGDTLTAQTFANGFGFDTRNSERDQTLLGAPPTYPLIDENLDIKNHLFREELNWVHQFAGGGRLDAKLSVNETGSRNILYRTGSGNALYPGLYSLIDTQATSRGLSSTGKYTSARFEGHALAFGWDGGYTTGDDTRRERDYRQPTVALPGGDDVYDSDVARVAVYAQDEWNVTPRWSVYLGGRWEGIRTHTEGVNFAAVHNRSSVLSPVAQTLYKLADTKGDQLRFAITRTYKAPGVQALIPHRSTSVNNSQIEPDTIGNPNLKPELALGLDASYEHYAQNGGLLSASVSSRQISDYTRNLILFDGARWVSTPSNNGSARTYGLELEARFPLKALLATTEAVDLRASVSRNWSTVESVPGPNNRLDGQTPLSATLGADYKKGALTAGASYVFKNGGFVRVSGNQVSYQSVKRDLDLYALWKFDAKLQLRLTTANLLAQGNVVESSYTTAGVGIQDSRTLTPVHRSVRATLEMKF